MISKRMSEPFVYPGIQLEPSQYIFYGKQSKGRFRLGNQYTTNEWKELLSKISWDTLPSIRSTQIQSFLQAEIGFRLANYNYTIKCITAIQQSNDSCNWYVTIKTEELDDSVVLKITMEEVNKIKLYKFSRVEFLGYQPHDRTQMMEPKEVHETVPDSKQASNFLYRNQIPGSFVLDKSTIHTMDNTNHAVFSKELDSNWPTLLHPDSTKKP